MATFIIPGSAFKGVSALGARQPDAGFYEVSIVEIAPDPNGNLQKRRARVQFPSGWRCLEFINLSYDNEGKVFAGLKENQVGGRTAALLSILNSLGYSQVEIEGANPGVSDEWFVAEHNGGRKGYVEFTPGQQGVDGSYPTIVRWMTQNEYQGLKDSGSVAQSTTTTTTTATAPVASAPVAAAPNPTTVPSNGGGAPTVQATLPPPPSAAQVITR